MSLAFQALCYLGAWEAQQPIQGGLAFESLLRRCRLDYSLGSLDRIDTLLDALRKTQKPQPQTFLQSQPNQNLLVLLAFYTGEVLARGLRHPVQWFTYQEMLTADPSTGVFGEGFNTSICCRFPTEAGAKVDFFLPLNAIAERLFNASVEKSVRFSAGLVFDQDTAQAQQPLPPLPPQHLGIDVPALAAQGSPMQRAALAMDAPEWVTGDKLQYLFDSAPQLLREGRVVWGAIIQANSTLFTADTIGGAPGELLYDPLGRVPPDDLVAIAQTVFKLKGRRMDDPALAAFSDYLTDEMIRVFGQEVPASVVPYPLKASTAYFDRRHLPGGRLAQAVLPVVISDSRPGAVMVLPAPLWPEALRAAWVPPSSGPDYGPPDSPEALFNEGFALFTGDGVHQNLPLARETWMKAAAAGHEGAMHNLGAMYAVGQGVARHLPTAIRYLRQAADKGSVQAQVQLAKVLLLPGEKTSDRKEAARLLKAAAQQGNDAADELLDAHGLRDGQRGLLGGLFGKN